MTTNEVHEARRVCHARKSRRETRDRHWAYRPTQFVAFVSERPRSLLGANPDATLTPNKAATTNCGPTAK